MLSKSEVPRVVLNLLIAGQMNLAVSYAIQTDEDLMPFLRKHIEDERELEAFAELVEVLR